MAFKLSPEFYDGQTNIVVKNKSELLEAVSAWADEAINYPGEPATISFVEMTDREIKQLPEA